MTEIIYLDSDCFHCHRTDDGTRIPFETDFFVGKCNNFVDGYYAIPAGQSLTLPDGRTFTGEMIAPCRDNRLNDSAQEQYEADLAEAAAAYQEGVDSV